MKILLEASQMADDRLVTFGDRVKAIREQNRISIRELAAMSGLNKSQIVRIESGQSDPHYTTLLRIADALEISVGDLVNVSKGADTLDGKQEE